MALQKAPFWTDLYYQVVQHYFWSPQRIGRISDPNKTGKPWAHWRNALASQETPLNHIIDLLFHIAPDDFIDFVMTALLGRNVEGFNLVETSEGTLDSNVVQPDMILCNGKELVFIEMKVDSQSSIDQYIKYAIASACIRAEEKSIKSVDLIMLTRKADHRFVWKNARRLKIECEDSLKQVARKALKDNSILCQRGVQKHFRRNPDDLDTVAAEIDRLCLHMVDYTVLKHAMEVYASKEKSLSNLIHGVIEELNRRSLA